MSGEIPKRPNRAHGAIDKLPEEVRLQIKDWYLGRPEEDIPRLTYEQISDELRELGYRISPNQVWRWLARQRNELDRMNAMIARAQAIGRQLVPKGTSMEAATVSLLNALCLEALGDAEVMQAKSIEDLARLAHATGRLQQSAVAREKWEHDKEKRIIEAVERLKEKVREEVAKDMDLMTRLVALIDQAAETMMEKIA